MPTDKIVPLRASSQHPADRALEIRYQIQLLKAELDGLRRHLLAHAEDRIGSEAVVSFKHYDKITFKRKELIEFFGLERLQPFMRATSVTHMNITDKDR